MSKGQTGRDNAGYKRGEKGFANPGQFSKNDNSLVINPERQHFPEGYSRGNSRPSRSDELGYEKGCTQGYSKCFDDGQFTGADYDKRWFRNTKEGTYGGVGQEARVGDGAKLKQRGY